MHTFTSLVVAAITVAGGFAPRIAPPVAPTSPTNGARAGIVTAARVDASTIARAAAVAAARADIATVARTGASTIMRAGSSAVAQLAIAAIVRADVSRIARTDAWTVARADVSPAAPLHAVAAAQAQAPRVEPADAPPAAPTDAPPPATTDTPTNVPTSTPPAIPSDTPTVVPTSTPPAVPTNTPPAAPTGTPTAVPPPATVVPPPATAVPSPTTSLPPTTVATPAPACTPVILVQGGPPMVSSGQVATMQAVLQQYATDDVAPVWPSCATVTLNLVDHPDPASGTPSWHNFFGGQVVAFLDVLDSGLDYRLASHEIAEALADPQPMAFVLGTYSGPCATCAGHVYQGPVRFEREVADPVENLTRTVAGPDGGTYALSDFVLPSFFQANGTAPYDWAGLVQRPQTPSQDLAFFDAGGVEQHVTGADVS